MNTKTLLEDAERANNAKHNLELLKLPLIALSFRRYQCPRGLESSHEALSRPIVEANANQLSEPIAGNSKWSWEGKKTQDLKPKR